MIIVTISTTTSTLFLNILNILIIFAIKMTNLFIFAIITISLSRMIIILAPTSAKYWIRQAYLMSSLTHSWNSNTFAH